ncbi:MAG TPA: choice-of-anchor tandem repeat NxxGxxAF-containing protein [Bryobacteraceae bacterium]|nr:choice-of-anchor tandem repeat NxxGxxAF-containing protein [Bryobacteraceae bacterium]
MRNIRLSSAMVLGIAVLAGSSLYGAEYTFTKILDNAPGSDFSLASFIGPFMINSHGTVAFTAAKSTTHNTGIYIGSGNGPVSTVFEGGLTVGSPRVNWATGFNDSGTVVYAAGGGIYTGTAAGGTPFQVVDVTQGSSIHPAINNAGTVAYGIGNTTIMTRNGSGAAQTLVSDSELPRAIALVAPMLVGLSINTGGTVAFYATNVQNTTGNCSCALYTKGPSGAAAQGTPFQQNITAVPQINDSGSVVFAGIYQGVKGVFVASGGQVGAAVDLSGQTLTLDTNNVTINANGEVAYFGNFILAHLQGIFTGPDNIKDKVIATGDPLFGSVVSEITPPQVPGKFLNDKGQIAFGYRLSNGLQGVAVATPVSTGAPLPQIGAGGVVNGASFAGGGPGAPGAIVSVFGRDFISQLAVPSTLPLPTSLKGVSVTFNGIKAPIYFIAPGQINVQAPYELTGSTATVQVTTPAGTSNTQSISLKPQSPAIFTADQSGIGQAIVVFAGTATIVGPIKSGTDWRPAKSGDTITIYANGLGAVTPSINDGWNSCTNSQCKADYSNLTLRKTVVQPVVTIGGVTATQISYSGLTPLFPGLYQINVVIPGGIPTDNNIPIVIKMGDVTSAPNVHIAMEGGTQ